ncbi:MAG: spore protease YyaC [Candidatus Coproplasma sp.]
MEFSFNLYNSLAPDGVFTVLKKAVTDREKVPVIVCVGSDLSVGDSLGPVTGTKLCEKLKGQNVYVYGTLAKPITAHEVKYMSSFLSNTHPDSPVIAIDAAVGVAGDIGLIKVANRPLAPGSGANKRLNKIGEVSILGIVAEKSLFNYSLFSSTRLNVIYKMAEIIAEGVSMYIQDCIQSVLLRERSALSASR